jgi:hypothetical protein
MKNKCFAVAALIIVSIFGWQAVDAQITITIPKFPKIKKPKIEQVPDAEPTTTTVSKNQTSVEKTSPTSTPDDEMDFRLKMFLEEIVKAEKEVDEYNSNDKLYLVGGTSADWMRRAVSAKERAEWTEKWKTLMTPATRKKFDDALAALNAAAAKQLPAYLPNPKAFNFHNPAEEKMMKGVLENPARYKIFKSGLNQANWLIDKNDYGLPTARYKHGMIYLRDTQSDHSYCYMTYVNVIQDYAGGGTYGASYARFIKDEMVGCPAGK